MTDEELGRAWASKHGKRPRVFADSMARWSIHWGGHFEIGKFVDELPVVLRSAVRDDEGFDRVFDSETAAYAALGSALRQLVTFADGVRGVSDDPVRVLIEDGDSLARAVRNLLVQNPDGPPDAESWPLWVELLEANRLGWTQAADRVREVMGHE